MGTSGIGGCPIFGAPVATGNPHTMPTSTVASLGRLVTLQSSSGGVLLWSTWWPSAGGLDYQAHTTGSRWLTSHYHDGEARIFGSSNGTQQPSGGHGARLPLCFCTDIPGKECSCLFWTHRSPLGGAIAASWLTVKANLSTQPEAVTSSMNMPLITTGMDLGCCAWTTCTTFSLRTIPTFASGLG